jgi:hypothetical protein
LPVVKIIIYRALSLMSVVKKGVFRALALMPVVKKSFYRVSGFIPVVGILIKHAKIQIFTKKPMVFLRDLPIFKIDR